MQKILFVCLGNICRSPLAEGIMLHLKAKHNLNVEIDSAGTAGYHIGEAPDKRTIANAKKNGVDLSALRARQFDKEDFDTFDKIYVMDHSNLRNVLALTKDQKQKEKVGLFLNAVYPGKDLEVPDPYYGTEQGFEDVFQLVYKACENFSIQFKVSV
ncbi:MAG: low molecular weight phosphotyrosine protein phosphatase [Bacteroidia bacterium]|nr:low molecular weight phosphotyrosine protein phosphatase [Bacteroidia bacterium]